MPAMRPLLTAAVLLSVALAAGCGGDSEADKIESVLRGYIAHYVESEPAEMYALLNAGSRARCSEEDFIAFIRAPAKRSASATSRSTRYATSSSTATQQPPPSTPASTASPRSPRRTPCSRKTAPGS